MGDRNYRYMIDPDEALQWVLDTAILRPPRRVSLADASGHCLAEEIRADRDHPPFPRAMMDGYAVRCADAGSALEIVGEVPAGTVPVGAERLGMPGDYDGRGMSAGHGSRSAVRADAPRRIAGAHAQTHSRRQ